MVYDFFPGCSLKYPGDAFESSFKLAASKLSVDFIEIPEWQCCGGVYPLSLDETASKLPSVRALNYSGETGRPLLAACSACYHVLKRVNYELENNKNTRETASLYLESPVKTPPKVVHFLEVLRDDIGFNKISSMVKAPLKGVKIAPYYGCLLLRPSEVMRFDDPHNPKVMEDLILALGGEVVTYPERNECCGGCAALEDKEITENKCEKIINSLKSRNADMIITSCPLCKYNLTKYGSIEVKYFTEILASAL